MDFTQSAGRSPTDDSQPSSSSSSSAFRWNDGGGVTASSGETSLVTYSSAAAPAAAAAAAGAVEKEHMFDKVVTPSDVGKLNRLVIPKQHAEKYFPLDASANERGMLLSFEDRAGKPWRFRYSYWNSSQSYVMTKGWSRFVKEKRLDAGDTVSFGRGVGEVNRGRLFIDWKRRPDNREGPAGLPRIPMPGGPAFGRSVGPWGGRFFPVSVYDQSYFNFGGIGGGGGGGGQLLYFRPPAVGRPPSAPPPVLLNSVPLGSGGPAAAKRVRLFGVNLDCPETDSESALVEPSNCHGMSHQHHYYHLGGSSGGSSTTAAAQLVELHQSSGAESSGASSSSTSREHQHSNLDLDL